MNKEKYNPQSSIHNKTKKTYVDVLLSNQLEKIHIVSMNAVLISAFLNLSGKDKDLYNIFSAKLENIGFICNVHYLVIYIALFINITILTKNAKHCISDIKPWERIRKAIYKDRFIYNFSTKKNELKQLPGYFVISIILLLFFGYYTSLSSIVVQPIYNINICSHYEYNMQVFYGVYILSAMTPYIILILIIFAIDIYKFLKRIKP